jgi:hypothetical protein
MKIKNYLLALLVFQFIFTTLLFSQSSENKIKVTDELAYLPFNASIKNDTAKPLNIFIPSSSVSFTDVELKPTLEYSKISGLNFNISFVRYNTSGKYSLSENDENYLDLNGGNGNALLFGAGYEFYLTSALSLETDICCDKFFTAMSANYNLPIIDDKITVTKHTVEFDILYISFDLLLKCEIFNDFYLSGGFKYGIPANSKYNHIVKIESNEIIYDGGATEKRFDGKTLDGVNNKSAVLCGASYRIPFIAGDYGIELNGNYELGLNKIIKNTDVKSNSFNFGIKLLYIF